jgi:hypothetical protein
VASTLEADQVSMQSLQSLRAAYMQRPRLGAAIQGMHLHDCLGDGIFKPQLLHSFHKPLMQLGRPHQPRPLQSARLKKIVNLLCGRHRALDVKNAKSYLISNLPGS